MHKRSLKDNLQRSKMSLKTTRAYEDDVIKLNTLKIRRLVRENLKGSTRKASTKEERNLYSKKEDKVPHSSRLADCPKAIEKEKGALEAKLEALKKMKKDSSESEGEEKANMCFMALENEVQSSPSNLSNFIDDDDNDPNSMLKMYDELKKISKKNNELKNKIDNLLNDNSKLVCENKTLLESLEVLKKEKDLSNIEFQKLFLENKNLCRKVLS
ncbi:hypothetical protein M9H77_21229 [Catharanthus roseus]|uniref:Uncharacterized protein n=1 Tax=Catharanthus roseus TaxID=4058 RepID=A0ACC0AR05_CATRO|nr:hypothetical protein M9H77_21229 [Catharanthus roseus]